MKTLDLPADPLVSVIMPAYNAELSVGEAIDSVLAQTYGNFELIVVDDGSTDNTLSLIREKEAADKRIRVITRLNGGLSCARNTGLSVIRGDVVCFIDSDDKYHPQTLAAMLLLMSDEDADIVVGSPIIARTEPDCWVCRPLKIGEVRRFDSEQAIEASLYQQPQMNSVCLMAIRASVFRENEDLRFVEGLYYEDLEISYRLFSAAHKVVYAPLGEYFYRQVEGSVVHTVNLRRLDVLKVTAGLEAAMSSRSRQLAAAAFDRRFSACYNIFMLLSAHGEEEYRKVVDECWREICARRWRTLLNPKVRIKNKVGALVSYLGKGITGGLARFMG